MTSPGSSAATSRVGWGFDAHRLAGEPPLRLGGVVVSNTQGVVATSDGDVAAHAVTDALMGACVLGDLGEHFPSDDPQMSGADSMAMLRETVAMATAAGWRVSHADVTIVAEHVMVSPHRNAIAAGLAAALDVDPTVVSVKATTTDGLGFVGSGEGIAAMAVVSVASVCR